MTRQKNNHIRHALTSLFPAKRIRKPARECKAVHRQRKIDIVALVFSLVLGFAYQKQRSLTEFRRAYEKSTRTRIAASAFNTRFSRGLVRLLREMLLDSLTKATGSSARATGRVLNKFTEVVAIDSTLIRLHNALEPIYPAVWTNHMRASAKLCIVMNVVTRGARTVKITHGSRHDVKTVGIGPWVMKKLLVFDLGYFKSTIFELIDKHDGFFLCRMRKQLNPLIGINIHIRHTDD